MYTNHITTIIKTLALYQLIQQYFRLHVVSNDINSPDRMTSKVAFSVHNNHNHNSGDHLLSPQLKSQLTNRSTKKKKMVLQEVVSKKINRSLPLCLISIINHTVFNFVFTFFRYFKVIYFIFVLPFAYKFLLDSNSSDI